MLLLYHYREYSLTATPASTRKRKPAFRPFHLPGQLKDFRQISRQSAGEISQNPQSPSWLLLLRET
jgi:hypothetical protein